MKIIKTRESCLKFLSINRRHVVVVVIFVWLCCLGMLMNQTLFKTLRTHLNESEAVILPGKLAFIVWLLSVLAKSSNILHSEPK